MTIYRFMQRNGRANVANVRCIMYVIEKLHQIHETQDGKFNWRLAALIFLRGMTWMNEWEWHAGCSPFRAKSCISPWHWVHWQRAVISLLQVCLCALQRLWRSPYDQTSRPLTQAVARSLGLLHMQPATYRLATAQKLTDLIRDDIIWCELSRLLEFQATFRGLVPRGVSQLISSQRSCLIAAAAAADSYCTKQHGTPGRRRHISKRTYCRSGWGSRLL
jgi:hypothetical protein